MHHYLGFLGITPSSFPPLLDVAQAGRELVVHTKAVLRQ